MRVCVSDEVRSAELSGLGGEDGDVTNGVVFAPGRVESWQQAEDTLVRAFEVSKAAALADAPVFYVIDAEAMLGRASVLDSAVAVGLVAAGRCLAFEGQRKEQFVTVLAVDAMTSGARIIDTVQFAASTKLGLGQTLMLSQAHLGAMLP